MIVARGLCVAMFSRTRLDRASGSAESILLITMTSRRQEAGRARVVAQLVARAGAGRRTVIVRSGRVEGDVVVAAVPDDDVGLLLGLAQDRLVVDAGVDDACR